MKVHNEHDNMTLTVSDNKIHLETNNQSTVFLEPTEEETDAAVKEYQFADASYDSVAETLKECEHIELPVLS